MSTTQANVTLEVETPSSRLGSLNSDWDQNPQWLQQLADQMDEYLTPIEIEMSELTGHWDASSHPFGV